MGYLSDHSTFWYAFFVVGQCSVSGACLCGVEDVIGQWYSTASEELVLSSGVSTDSTLASRLIVLGS